MWSSPGAGDSLVVCLSVVMSTVVTVAGFLTPCDTSVCGRPVIQPRGARIVGGEESLPGTMPWMAMLVSCGNFACGGVILNKQFILTAAHCFFDDGGGCDLAAPESWDVYLGKHNVQKYDFGEQKFQLQSIYIHPLYDDINKTNDIALLHLAGSIMFDSLIRPACLPTLAQIPRAGQSCIVAGYGDTLTFDRFTLHHVSVPIVSDDVCLLPDWYGTQGIFFPSSQFCAGVEEGGRDACYGDSGSPLVCKFDDQWFVSGIVSTGQRCGLPRQPGIYSNVTVHQLWIRTTMTTHANLMLCDIF